MPEDPEIVRIAMHYRAELRQGERRAVERMTRAYVQLHKRMTVQAALLQKEIEAAVAAGEAMPEWRIVGLNRYRELMAQLERELARINVESARLVAGLQRQAIRAGVDMAELQFAELVPAGVGLTFNKLPVTALENLIGFLADGSPLANLLDEMGRETATRVGQTLVRGLGMGWHPTKTAKAIRQQTGMGLTRAIRIARTEQLRAWRASTIQGYRDQGTAVVTGYRRHAQKDGRTCIACLLEDGAFYTSEQDFTDHVQGRCALVPVTRSWSELGYEGIEDTNPTWQSGRDWFSQQKGATQEAILGRPVYRAWRNGEIALDDMKYLHQDRQWGDSWQAASLMRARGEAERRRM